MNANEKDDQLNQPDDELMEQLIPAYGFENEKSSAEDHEKLMEQLAPYSITERREESELVDDDINIDATETIENGEPISELIDSNEEPFGNLKNETESIEPASELIEDTEPLYELTETNEQSVEPVFEPTESLSSDSDEYFS